MLAYKDIAVGLCLFKFLHWRVELWYCKPNKTIPLHKHAQTDSHIYHLFGKGRLKLENRAKYVKNFSWLFNKPVKAGMVHGADAYTFGILFVNFERLIKRDNRSITEDFQEA